MGQLWGLGTRGCLHPPLPRVPVQCLLYLSAELTLPIETSRKEVLPAPSQPARKFLLNLEALPLGLLLQEPPFSCPDFFILWPTIPLHLPPFAEGETEAQRGMTSSPQSTGHGGGGRQPQAACPS